jgi:hypothetical protein
LVIFGALSIYANGIHAVGGSIAPTAAFIIGAVAPVALLMSTHLLVLMLHSPVPDKTDEQLAASVRKANAAALLAARASAGENVRALPQAASALAAPDAAVGAALLDSDGRDSTVSRIIAHHVQFGEWPTGAVIGSWVGRSSRTGTRLLQEARNQFEGDFA